MIGDDDDDDDDDDELFCGMVDQRKAFSLISSQDHFHGSSPSQISNMPQAGFESAQNLSSGLVDWSCDNTTAPLVVWLLHFKKF